MKSAAAFTGFDHRAVQFLNDLRKNNSKAWFEENKHLYTAYLLDPCRFLVSDLGDFMLGIDPDFEVRPAINKTISRIYRDTRFSKDKSLFKTNVWITFKKPIKDWQNAPAYFFEIASDFYRYGMGFYSASAQTMSRLRKAVLENSLSFQKANESFWRQNIFTMEGEKYKKKIASADSLNEKAMEWMQRKNIYFAARKNIDDLLFQPELARELKKGFKILSPIYEFFVTTQLFFSREKKIQ
jgi:uncharacterized protein (TIGR02453 family)